MRSTISITILSLLVSASGTISADALYSDNQSLTARESLQTLFSGDIESGGYGAPVVKTTTINGQTGVLVGGQGGWIINDTFSLGGGGYGLASTVDVPDAALAAYTLPAGAPRDLELGLGYGGVLLEYFHRPNRLVHLTASTLIGAGAVVYADYKDDDKDNDDSWDVSDAFFAFEPGVHVEMNVTSWMRVAAGGSYLLVRDLDIVGLENDDIGGFTGNIAFKFGSF